MIRHADQGNQTSNLPIMRRWLVLFHGSAPEPQLPSNLVTDKSLPWQRVYSGRCPGVSLFHCFLFLCFRRVQPAMSDL